MRENTVRKQVQTMFMSETERQLNAQLLKKAAELGPASPPPAGLSVSRGRDRDRDTSPF
jgi:hypothetical protein